MNILSIHPMGARVELGRAELLALQKICEAGSMDLLDKGDGRWLTAEALAGAFQACALAVEAVELREVYHRDLDRRVAENPLTVWVHPAPEGV